MTKLLCFFVLIGLAVLLPVTTFSQYILNGNANKESCNCYLLTQPVTNQSGSVWQQTKINLNDPFDFSFNVYLGCQDLTGADGIAFILQPISTSLGATGGGIGFDGVSPSIGILLDTWQNFEDNDPAFDHISIQANGVIGHGTDLAGPIPASASGDNIEDCAWHVFRIKWDPLSHTLSTYFDGIFRLSTQTDMVANVFKNDPMVYWGFSAATGGSYNVQRFCTALNPDFNSGLINDQICFGTPVTLHDSSTSFTTIKNYYWDFGDGSTSTLANPPAHTYAQPGIYEVKHSITAADGCESEEYKKKITIGDKPDVSFKAFDTCETLTPRMDINAKVAFGNIDQWKWEVDGVPFSNTEKPDLSTLSPGSHSLQLTITSSVGCVSDPYSTNFIIKNKPAITINANDGCINAPVSFSSQQTDNLTTIDKWHWNFGDNLYSDQKNAQHIYSGAATYSVQLTATASNGCMTTFSKNILIHEAHANAGNDTVVLPNTMFQLQGSGGTNYTWSPATGLSNPSISNPIGNVTDDISYLLTVKTPEECSDTSSVKVIVFKGSAIYVPTAFTPNNDGLNDFLKPSFTGIKTLNYFTIYNRWGQKVFSTNNVNKGWDGYYKGTQNNGGTFVWVLKAIDLVGRPYNLKGTFILLR